MQIQLFGRGGGRVAERNIHGNARRKGNADAHQPRLHGVETGGFGVEADCFGHIEPRQQFGKGGFGGDGLIIERLRGFRQRIFYFKRPLGCQRSLFADIERGKQIFAVAFADAGFGFFEPSAEIQALEFHRQLAPFGALPVQAVQAFGQFTV